MKRLVVPQGSAFVLLFSYIADLSNKIYTMELADFHMSIMKPHLSIFFHTTYVPLSCVNAILLLM